MYWTSTIEGHKVEVETTSTGLPPDDQSGLSLNNSKTFWRVDGGPWRRSPERSQHATVQNISGLIELLLEWNVLDRARS